MTSRPNCAICGSAIPESLLSDKDWKAELAYVAEINDANRRQKKGLEKPRDFFCSMGCFQTRRDAVTSSIEGRSASAKRAAATRKANRRRWPE